jgi:hypothetical protein
MNTFVAERVTKLRKKVTIFTHFEGAGFSLLFIKISLGIV